MVLLDRLPTVDNFRHVNNYLPFLVTSTNYKSGKIEFDQTKQANA